MCGNLGMGNTFVSNSQGLTVFKTKCGHCIKLVYHHNMETLSSMCSEVVEN